MQHKGKVLFTSDLHCSHKKIVEFTNRSIEVTQEQHDEWLVQIWNSQVNPEDTVWHLGDLSFASSYAKVQEFVAKLNGVKMFIKGNHDKLDFMRRLVKDGLVDWFGDYKEIKLKEFAGTSEEREHNAVLCHFPFAVWHRQHHGALHLHGHSHGSYTPTAGKILDVGLDSSYNIYKIHRFFTEENVLEYMKERSTDVLDHHVKRKGE